MDQGTLILSLSACVAGFAVAALALAAWAMHRTSTILQSNHELLWNKLMLLVVQQIAHVDPMAAQDAIRDIARHGIAGVDAMKLHRKMEEERAARFAREEMARAFQRDQEAGAAKARAQKQHRVRSGFMPTFDENEESQPQETNHGSPSNSPA